MRVGARSRGALFDRCHEAATAPVHGLHGITTRGIVAQGPARGGDVGGNDSLAHRLARPQPIHQLVPRHHAVAVANEHEQHVEDLGLELDSLPALTQLV
jgi:hypothetical protein